MLVFTSLAAAVAPNPIQRLMRIVVADKTRDPTTCLTQMFQNYQAISNCASRTCTCAGGSWSTTAPYCTGASINCAAAAKCYPIGNQCFKSLAPDCEAYFAQGCTEAATAAGCPATLCTANSTAVRRGAVDVHKAKRGHAVAAKVLAALFMAKAAKKSKPVTVASPASDALQQVLLGLVEGIEGDVGNITRCLPEEEGAWQDLETFVSEIADAIKTGNRNEAADAFSKLIAAVSLAQKAAADCGLDTVAADLAAIVAELSQPGGWLKVLEEEGYKIFVHSTDITADLLDAVNDWRSSNYNSFGQDIGRILGLLL